MKKIIVSLLIMVCSSAAFCQYDTTPPYLRTKLLPGFNLLSLDSALFDQSVLVANNNTIIMLFNPECEHCQDQLKLMLSIPELVASTNVILTSTETLEKIKIFYDKFHLENYPRIHIGKDHKYFFGGFFQPKTIPVLAFYNKQKLLVYFNQGSVKKKQILDALKN